MQTSAHELPDDQCPQVGCKRQLLCLGIVATLFRNLAPSGWGDGAVQRLHIIGMGKLGGGELNVSSDVDLIFAYPEDGETDGARRISNQEYFTRLGRRLIAALSEVTADGHVFRVDMRLRPYG